MNKFKFLLFLLIIPLSVSASCDSSSLSRYKSLAANISNYYEYNGSSFDVTFYNVSSELKIVNKLDGREYFPNSNFGDVVINNFSDGDTSSFAVYPSTGECSIYRVFTFYINFPYYNKYSSDEICINNTSVLCSKWTNTSMYNYDQFVSAVIGDKKEEIVSPQPVIQSRKYGFFDFLGDYYIFILLFIIISGSIGIYFLDKKSKFDF